MGKIMLEVKDLKTKYVTRFKENVFAVDGVSLEIEEGKSLGVAGESGCGKSTLALSLMGYYFAPLHYISGDIIIDGKNISGMKPDDVRKNILGTEVAYIPQAAMNALNPTQKVIRFIEDVIHAHDKSVSKKDIFDMARKRFEILGLPQEVLNRYSVELSGGMKQRTVIAISTILSPKVLIADEPSSALDVTSQKMVIKMMRDLMDKGYIKSMIFITHELPLLYNVTDHIMVMYAGQIVERGTARDMVFDPVHPYSKGLMGSIIVPEEGTRDVKLEAIPGTPPNLKNPPAGCRFAARCKYVIPNCSLGERSKRIFDDNRMHLCIHSVEFLKETYAKEGIGIAALSSAKAKAEKSQKSQKSEKSQKLEQSENLEENEKSSEKTQENASKKSNENESGNEV
ncbi:MAG: ABC transporter ATP-binding protein [Defluviitaleaceae bacterium]|nr:ABC transporter ATP-binding protein [Defluviitaleaceae bacterium]